MHCQASGHFAECAQSHKCNTFMFASHSGKLFFLTIARCVICWKALSIAACPRQGPLGLTLSVSVATSCSVKSAVHSNVHVRVANHWITATFKQVRIVDCNVRINTWASYGFYGDLDIQKIHIQLKY